MAFSLSPAVLTTEIAKDNIVPSVATSIGAAVIDAHWGPAEDIVAVSSEEILVNMFGTPSNTNYKDWLCTSSFLAYSSDMRIIRAIDKTTALNSNVVLDGTSGAPTTATGQLIINSSANSPSIVGASSPVVARYAGVLGNSITTYVSDSTQFATNTINITTNGVAATADFDSYFDIVTPDADELYVIVKFNDTATDTDSILETFIVSKTVGARNENNEVYFADDYISKYSNWIYFNYSALTAPTTDYDYTFVTTADEDGANVFALGAGVDGSVASGDYTRAWDIFASSTDVDINLLVTGGANAVVGKYALENVAEIRKDCVAFLSPSDLGLAYANSGTNALDLVDQKNTDAIPSSSYGFMDGNAKYVYDRYSDTFRWIPLNGDMAGLCARTDYSNDPWWSPAGFNRGNVKSVVKLGFAPSKADRDILYKNNINPVVTFSGQGTVLFGDKTLLSKPGSFQYINVRRLFIVLEKAISTSSQYLLFEFNDAQTRQLFLNMVNPYLRRVKGRSGVHDFRVVCDDTNNTGAVIDAGEFIGDIYIKPRRSINVIHLNFISTPTGVAFSEII